ncbi:helix-turn-helix domain-containing protein [Brenneria populi]|uniref:Helix-turn-helix domain-containing protein n=1 Tax=Brenneria populi TaxID=1505588 RepID=A0ABU6JR04_9GAMM|nr:helix-turn-helix domain-containing protein [Brenneria populi Li et al. 2015]
MWLTKFLLDRTVPFSSIYTLTRHKKDEIMDYCSFVQELIVWIEDNLYQSLTLDAVAEKSGYSKWHLQRIFHTVTGEKIGIYIRNKRLEMAAIELAGNNQKISDISSLYGFSSQHSFSRAFKNKFKCSPTEFRKIKNRLTTNKIRYLKNSGLEPLDSI